MNITIYFVYIDLSKGVGYVPTNEQINNILYDRESIYPAIKVDGLSNTMKYRMKLHLTEDEWIQQVPTLMKLFGIQHMEELEKEIIKLL